MNELLHHLLQQAADDFPGSTAVVDGDREMTYRQLDTAANRIAHQLARLDVRRGDRIGLYLEKSAESLACIYGVLKAGAAYVPLAPDAPPARLARTIQHAGIRVLLTGTELARRWPAVAGPDSPVDYVICVNGPACGSHELLRAAMLDAAHLARQPTGRPEVTADAEDLAYILYTSGSTSAPKGVMLTHKNALAFVSWAVREFALTRRDRLSNHAPLHFDLSVFDLFAAAAVAAPVILVPREVAMFPAELAAFVRAKDISVWYSVPSAVNVLASRCGQGPSQLPRLRLVLFAGEVFPMGQLRQALAAFPDADFYNLYGPTETNVCTFYRVARPLDEASTSIPIGHPIDGVELFCLHRRRPSGADRRAGRAVGQRPDGHARIPGRPRAHRAGAERPRPRAAGCDGLPDGRSGRVPRGRGMAFLRAPRFPDQEPRLPDRAGGDRGHPQGHPSIVECAVVPIPDAGVRQPDQGLCRYQESGQRDAARRVFAQVPAQLHGAVVLRPHHGAAADFNRENRLSGTEATGNGSGHAGYHRPGQALHH